MYMWVLLDILYFVAFNQPVLSNYLLLPLAVVLQNSSLVYVTLLPRYGKPVFVESKLIFPFIIECVAYGYILLLPSYYCLDLAYLWFIVNFGRLLCCKFLPLYTIWSLSSVVIHLVFFSWLTLPFTVLRLLSEVV
jgi:hypothetical protein